VKAAEARDVLSAGSLLSRLASLHQAAQEILDDARRKGDHNLALQAISKASSLLQVQGAAIAAARGAAAPGETSSVEAALEEIRRGARHDERSPSSQRMRQKRQRRRQRPSTYLRKSE
jgi:hypothetical protein